MKQIKTFSLAFTYVGCFLGAGFISGQELWQFFGAFGNWAMWALPWRRCCLRSSAFCSSG